MTVPQYEIIQATTQHLKLHINFQKHNDFQHITHSNIKFYCRCKIAFYANDSQLSNRKTSFGYGQKLDFTKTSVVGPASTIYNLKS